MTVTVPSADVRGVRGLPSWAAALDAVVLVLCLLAWGAARHGRVHIHPLGMHFSATWIRLLLDALVVAAARHAFLRRPSLPEHLWSIARGAWTSPALRAAVVPFVASRAAVYITGFLAIAVIGLGPESHRYRFFDNEFTNMLARWDANWYTGIAEGGYHWNPDPRAENPVVFFPSFPMLIRAVAWLVPADTAYAGFVVSLVAFLWALCYLYRLARDYLGTASPDAAVMIAAWYPFGLFYSAVYSESLFLLGLTAAFYHAHARQRGRAAAWAFLVGFTKPNGFLLAAPLFLLLAQGTLRRSGWGWRPWRDPRAMRALLADAAVAACPIVALGLYSLYNWQRFGDPLVWLHGQRAWGRVYHGLAGLTIDPVRDILRMGPTRYVLRWPVNALNASAAILALASVVPVARRFGVPHALLVVCLIVPPLLAGGTLSVGRLTTALFPMFLWLAAAIPARHRPTTCALLASGEVLVAILVLTWRPLY